MLLSRSVLFWDGQDRVYGTRVGPGWYQGSARVRGLRGALPSIQTAYTTARASRLGFQRFLLCVV